MPVKIKRVNVIAVIACLSATLIYSSCKKNTFLDEQPLSDYTLANSFQSKGLVDAMMVGAYQTLQSVYAYHFQICTNAGDDLSIWNANLNNEDAFQLSYQYASNVSLIRNIWAKLYDGVNRCNTIIDRIDGSPVNDPAYKKRIKGDAYFLRGLYYYHLARMFGGLPIQLSETTSYSYDFPRLSAAQAYKQVIDDFTAASADGVLPNVVNADMHGKATQGAAKAMLAKTYLMVASLKYYSATSRMDGTYYKSDENGKPFDAENIFNVDDMYTKAYDMANNLINNRAAYNFGLNNFYGDNFKYTNKNSIETIYAVQFRTQIGFGTAWGKWKMGALATPALGNQNSVAPYVNALVGFQANLKPAPGLYDGLGLNLKDVRTNYYTVGDSRREWNIATYRIGKNPTTGAFREEAVTPRGQWGIVKFRYGTLQDAYEANAVPWQNGMNVHIIRFAELYLIRAEAGNHKPGRDAMAVLNDINVIRNRARGSFFNKDMVTYMNETFIPKTVAETPAFPNYDLANVAALKVQDPNTYSDVEFYDLLIMKERTLELAWENQRIFDMMRTGTLHSYHEAGNTINSNKQGANFAKGRSYVYPLPDAEVSVHINKETFKQNPGY